jgi:short subunit dehydrogenase-like uncharacterized protein
MSTWMIYGANGYTGELMAEEAARRGEKPILAGRREEAVRPLAERLGCEHRVFSLDSPGESARGIDGCKAVLLAAGPFSATSKPIVEACLRAGAHYADITGEIAVFERCHRRDAEAKKAGIVIMPGVGFDVVPSDCLAASLKLALPSATKLELAFASDGGTSRGTAKTMVEGLPQGGAIRRDGKIVKVPVAWQTPEIRFRDRPRRTMSIPWGDVSTAWYSTGIPNIVVYMGMPPKMIRAAKLARPFLRFAGLPAVQRYLKRRIDRRAAGPGEEMRRHARTHLWGRAGDGTRSVEGTLETPEGYTLTALTSVEATLRIVRGEVEPGARTPSMAFGAGFISQFEGCDLRIEGVGAGAGAAA